MNPVVLFSALADPTRCRVLEMLHERPMPVHELAAAFAISRPAISRHLRVLKEAMLVREEKHGRENVYSLQRQQLRPMVDWLDRHRKRGRLPPAAAPAAPAAPPKVQMELEL
jgi:DNA-binding transcriptional ArsR family regulator